LTRGVASLIPALGSDVPIGKVDLSFKLQKPNFNKIPPRKRVRKNVIRKEAKKSGGAVFDI